MNFRTHIQEMIEQLQDIYDRAGALRDHAEGYEKEPFNQVRGKTADVWPLLQKLDNSLNPDRATENIFEWRKK